MELYISGEYSGTFRGESFLPSTPSFTPAISGPGGAGGGSASPPLFLIQIDQESLLHRCRNLLFKTDTTGATTTTAVDNVEPTATATTAYSDVSTTPTSHISPGHSTSSSQNLGNQTSSNFSASAFAHSYIIPPGISTSIDLDKVRQMLSQVQIDNMPQGAKDLMRTMEMQSFAQQQQQQQQQQQSAAAASFMATGGGLSPSPIVSPPPPWAYTAITPPLPPLPHSPLPPPSIVTSSLTPPSESTAAAEGEMTTFVTRAELALMEERIMTKIEQRFQEMEDRILNKLLLANKQADA
ncbi:hypothetical protein KI688_008488 [Linnemannia hyalina]|uniref:Uncharacterized protein n=1 Tax=Linnemannia hyalina TaxID=64524 RepID=A0A9P8BWI9_9FUNG|nr:hypothetical protein KI688_008488 [Linnemannia hyalina]